MPPVIETCDLTREFHGRAVVKSLSLTIPSGALYGFLGPNGAGKTTTLRMLLGLIRPTSGTALVCGHDVGEERARSAAQVGALLEGHGLYGNLSGRDNLGIACQYRGLVPSEIDRVLALVDLRNDGRRPVSQYSLGMRQRLGLARALLGRPPVLILDEPTNGLDPEGVRDLRELLVALPTQAGTTVLLSSHLLSEVEQVATHIGIIHQGALRLEGELAMLQASPSAVTVSTDNPTTALAVAAANCFEARLDGPDLVATALSGQSGEAAAIALTRCLVEAGVGVSNLSRQRRSLAQVYHEVVQAGPGELDAA